MASAKGDKSVRQTGAVPKLKRVTASCDPEKLSQGGLEEPVRTSQRNNSNLVLEETRDSTVQRREWRLGDFVKGKLTRRTHTEGASSKTGKQEKVPAPQMKRSTASDDLRNLYQEGCSRGTNQRLGLDDMIREGLRRRIQSGRSSYKRI